MTPSFITAAQSSNPLLAGIRTAFLGSLWVLLVTFIFSFPFGIGAALYLEEYAKKTRFTKIMQLNIFNLSAIPSIIYGLLGLAFFVRILEPFTSGAIFTAGEATVANGRTILSGGLTPGGSLFCLSLSSTRRKRSRLCQTLSDRARSVWGATKWQTIWHHVLPRFDRENPHRSDPCHEQGSRRDSTTGGHRSFNVHLRRPDRSVQ